MKIEDVFVVTTAVLHSALMMTSYGLMQRHFAMDWIWIAVGIAGVLSIYAVTQFRQCIAAIRRLFFGG